MEIIKLLGRRLSPPKSSKARSQCQYRYFSFVCPAHIHFPSHVNKHSTSTVTLGVAIPSRCSSPTWASSCPNLSARRRGSASCDPSNVNHVDQNLGLPALRVLSTKSMHQTGGLSWDRACKQDTRQGLSSNRGVVGRAIVGGCRGTRGCLDACRRRLSHHTHRKRN